MRRFEFVEGSSAKFWAADVEGLKFIVVYGKIGTAGSRKEKEFPSAEAAYKEYEKKVAEKVREGYKEVEGGTAPAAPPPTAAAEEKREAKKAGPPPMAPRGQGGQVTGEGVAAAVRALARLGETLGGKRSWRARLEARRARRALERLGGVDPAEHGELGAALEGVLSRVGRGKGKLSLLRALDLLWALDVRVYERQLAAWRSAEQPPKEVLLLAKLAEQFPEPELSFRLGCLLLDRPGRGISGNEAGWGRLWREVAPYLQAKLSQDGTTLRKFLQTIDTAGDPPLAARVARLKEH
jgi:predicted DNA-binding WGR domain protein